MKLGIPQDLTDRARGLARRIAEPVQEYIGVHTTVTVERATLRLFGADGVNPEGVPVPNLLVDSLGDRISRGAAEAYLSALVRKGWTTDELNRAVAEGFDISSVPPVDRNRLAPVAEELIGRYSRAIDAHAALRRSRIAETEAKAHSPLLYVIVATGNIYEDVKQAAAAVYAGADIVAVIRTTAQSLLDYVPYGATTTGFGGTYATQENFRIMRAALDEAGKERGKYIRLVNYASGLCMPEIAAMGAMERLDMMLNDSMYGILFRDINMYRTFVDQNFSRMITAYGGIVINTGEDNYLTTADAFEKGHTVLASQFINERFAGNAGMPEELMGLGHAFEIDPSLENSFLYEIAQALLVREVFPKSPIKYMPPTKHMTGDIFKGYRLNTLYNLAAKITGQGILLLGMLTEAIHTPFLQDRFLALENAAYVFNAAKDLGDEIEWKADGIIVRRGFAVLNEAIALHDKVASKGLFESIEAGVFADIKRKRSGGKGFEGVVAKDPGYWNPWEDFLRSRLGIGQAGLGGSAGRGGSVSAGGQDPAVDHGRGGSR